MEKAKRYTSFVPRTDVLVPSQAEVLALSNSHMNHRLESLRLTLSMYKAKFKVGTSGWKAEQQLLDADDFATEPPLPVPQVIHEDVCI